MHVLNCSVTDKFCAMGIFKKVVHSLNMGCMFVAGISVEMFTVASTFLFFNPENKK